MTLSQSRRTRRKQLNLVVAGLLAAVLPAVLWLAAWYCMNEFGGPNVVVRVLFSETANCTQRERQLVAGVMRNRMGNPAFGGATNLIGVVEQPGAFSCIGDGDNANWRKSRHPERMTPAERAVWERCLACVNGGVPPAVGPSGRPLVYYHDRSVGTPASWANAKWRAVREESTEHFLFYSIVPAEPRH